MGTRCFTMSSLTTDTEGITRASAPAEKWQKPKKGEEEKEERKEEEEELKNSSTKASDA